jgi:hypothetical protein
MLPKNRPVRLLPLINGKLDGAIHPISPNPITDRSFLNQFLWKLHVTSPQHHTQHEPTQDLTFPRQTEFPQTAS